MRFRILKEVCVKVVQFFFFFGVDLKQGSKRNITEIGLSGSASKTGWISVGFDSDGS